MKIIFLLLIATISSSVSAQTEWLNYFSQLHSLSDTYIDYHYGQKNWTKDPDYGQSLRKVTPKKNSNFSSSLCAGVVYPAHPLATTKEYHEALYKRLEHHKMPGDAHYCDIPGYKKRRCLRSGAFKFVIISDTFVDRCGNYFRGYWSANYYWSPDKTLSEENMGTLLAKGRNIRQDPNSDFKDDYLPTTTRDVYKSEFIYLTPLLKGDKQKIKKAIEYSERRFGLKKIGNHFKE